MALHLPDRKETRCCKLLVAAQEEFADRAQISARHVQSLEAGTKLPTVDTVFKIARAFTTSPGPLLDPLWQDWR